MIISDLYEIKISSDKSRLSINETVTITVKAIDFNGANLTGKRIQLSCDKGTFVVSNQDIGKVYTGTTSTNGFTVTYKATEPGVISFEAYLNVGNLSKPLLENLSEYHITQTPISGLSLSGWYFVKDSGDSTSTDYLTELLTNERLMVSNNISFEKAVVSGQNLVLNGNTVYKVNIPSGITSFSLSYNNFDILNCNYSNNAWILSNSEYGLKEKQNKLQLFASTYKRIIINTSNGSRNLMVNEYTGHCYFSYYFPKQNMTSNFSTDYAIENAIIPSAYRPSYAVRVRAYNPSLVFTLKSDGKIYRRIESSFNMGSEAWIRFDWIY